MLGPCGVKRHARRLHVRLRSAWRKVTSVATLPISHDLLLGTCGPGDYPKKQPAPAASNCGESDGVRRIGPANNRFFVDGAGGAATQGTRRSRSSKHEI